MGNSIYLGGGIKSAFCGGNVKEIWQGENKLWGGGGKQEWSTDILPNISLGKYPIDSVGYSSGLTTISKRSGLVNADSVGYSSGLTTIEIKEV